MGISRSPTCSARRARSAGKGVSQWTSPFVTRAVVRFRTGTSVSSGDRLTTAANRSSDAGPPATWSTPPGRRSADLLHRDRHVADAERHLHDMVRDLLAEAAAAGAVRDDVAPDELASYCLHALSAAGSLPSKAAIRRLVTVTVAGLRAGTNST
jgi:hypothetical protein